VSTPRSAARDRLLEAALDEFTTKGYHRTKIAELCARAGVSTRNFYERFPSKEALLLELHAEINATALKRMLPVLESLQGKDPLTRITVLIDTFIAAVTSDPRYPRLAYVEAPGVSVAMERQHQDWFSRYVRFIEEEAHHAAADGLAPDRDFHLTAIAIVGAVTGVLREWQMHDPALPVDEVTKEVREFTIAAITRRA
jgi:AcrR family transcriptional regulator